MRKSIVVFLVLCLLLSCGPTSYMLPSCSGVTGDVFAVLAATHNKWVLFIEYGDPWGLDSDFKYWIEYSKVAHLDVGVGSVVKLNVTRYMPNPVDNGGRNKINSVIGRGAKQDLRIKYETKIIDNCE